MNNLTKKYLFTSLIAFTIFSLAIPVTQAQQNNSPTTEKPAEKEKTQKSPSMLESLLRLIKSPENRLITRGDELCLISPGNIGEQIIYGDRPVFIWQGTIPDSTINVYSSSANYNYEQDEQLIWTQEVAANSQNIAYKGETLQSGFIYDWELTTTDSTYRATFVVMKDVNQVQIDRDIAAIKDRLKAENKENEEIAIAVTDYLAQKQLWSDVLQQLYTVENPSANLTSKIEDIEQYLCESVQ
jgi:hypothetical protein